ncbi:MAG: hypothetical protein U5J94_03010 [Thiohalophilus sp.]|nr:hypothetical protein [Thiohalophilus sp.]MDZ7661331.1 hypothetical protein [Thiohalophilus sp.]
MTRVMPLLKQQEFAEERIRADVRFQVYTERHLDRIAPLRQLERDQQRFEMRVVASVLPFRVNQYVIDELIDWNNIPNDPMFQLTFPQRGMLAEADFERMAEALRSEDKATIQAVASDIRAGLNPHPAGQQLLNVPQTGRADPGRHSAQVS